MVPDVSGSSTMSKRSVVGVGWAAASGDRICWASARRDCTLLSIEATALRHPLTPLERDERTRRGGRGDEEGRGKEEGIRKTGNTHSYNPCQPPVM